MVNPTGEWCLSSTSLKNTDELAVAHSDGVLQIWSGDQLKQMLVHPREPWTVKQLANGDLITGCPQGKITIWSRDPSRQADEATIATFNSETFNSRSRIAAATGKQLDVNTLPLAQNKAQHIGTKDGDIRQFNKNGKAFTYRWDVASRSWVEMGESTGSSGQEVDGTYYDKVLNVEIDLPGQGVTPCKLGFNDGDNPYIVAQKFCAKHKIDAMQVQQIVDFINQNRSSSGPTIGSQAGNYGSDMTMAQIGEGGTLDMAQLMNGGGGVSSGNMTMAQIGEGGTLDMAQLMNGGGGGGFSRGGAYNGGDPSAASSYGSSKQTPRSERWPSPDFPQRLPLPFDSNRNALNGMTKAITEISVSIYDDDQQLILNDLLDTICETSRYHASKVTDQSVQLIIDTLTSTNGINCPLDQLFPFMDLLRGCCLHLDFVSRLCTLYRLDDVLTSLMNDALKLDEVKTAHTFLFLQAICNLLVNSTSRDGTLDFLATNQDVILGNNASTLSQHNHKHVLNGYATLLLNISSHILNETSFGSKNAIMFSQYVIDRGIELMTHATNKAAAANGKMKKVTPMLVVAKRAFVATGTVRVCASVNTDSTSINSACDVIIQLNADWIVFHDMVMKCISQYEKK
jgi:hypothetical protein